jgi:hypothetical protein
MMVELCVLILSNTQVPIKQRECLDKVSIIEESMVKGFPFEVPKEYSQLPQLLVGGCWWADLIWQLSRPAGGSKDSHNRGRVITVFRR